MKVRDILSPAYCLGAMLMWALPAALQAQFEYVTNNGTITITHYAGPGGDVAIPGKINGLPVRRLDNYAFYGWNTLTSVAITNSITSIGTYAFWNCTSLTQIVIPNSITNIGEGAFTSCIGLANVSLGSSLTSIEAALFNGCSSLAKIVIPNSAAGIGDNAFYNCGSLTNATIGTNVTSIGNNAFTSCSHLINVNLPDNVTNVGAAAFSECIRLPSVTIPGRVTCIGDSSFYDCTSLTNVTIGMSVTNIGAGVFSGCASLKAITVEVANPAYSSLAGVLFDRSQTHLIQCPQGIAGSYGIPNRVTAIEPYAFTFCTRLSSVSIPGTVTNIGDGAFAKCTNLAGIYFSRNVPGLGTDVFFDDARAEVYFLPGTTGWGSTFGGLPTRLWNPLVRTSSATFGVRTNHFGFTITGSSNLVIVVEASADLANPTWIPVGTNTLNTFVGTNGTTYFSDPQWTNLPDRFYRLRSP